MSRNIQIREPGNNYADVLHPETNSGMVLMANGKTLQEDCDAHKADYASHKADYASHKADYASHKADYASHKADSVTDSNGAHGLKVESGTFTPTIIGLTTTGDNTYSTNSGFYEKIGRTVFFHIYIVMTAKDPAMEGSVRIAGLPFVAYSQSNRHSSVSIGAYSNIVTAGKQLGGFLQDDHATVRLHLSGDNIADNYLFASGINDGTRIRVSGMYQTF